MLVIPIGREKGVLRRHAWVTYTVISLNLAMFLLFCLGGTDQERGELIRGWRSTIAYLRERPYLIVPLAVADLMPRELRERRPDPAGNEGRALSEQAAANRMAADLRKRYEALDDVRLAYVPAAGSFSTILSSMFLHASLLHLLGNMLFLFVTAPFVEDAFGRPLFAVLYLSGGVVATLVFASRDPDSVIPLVGASGAIAAVMGAYLVRFAQSRLEFLFIPVLPLPFWNFRFSLPALVVLPLWFLEQVVSIPAEGDSGVAVTAHVAGFVYGLVVALLIRFTRVEERFINPAIEKQVSWTADPRLEAALQAFAAGDIRRAQAQLGPLFSEQPGDEDALRLGLDIALELKSDASIDTAGTRLLACLMSRGDIAEAEELIAELRPHALPRFLDRAAGFAERRGQPRQAIGLYERLAGLEAAGVSAVAALFKVAVLRNSSGDSKGAREALVTALKNPHCSDEWRKRIYGTLSGLSGQR